MLALVELDVPPQRIEARVQDAPAALAPQSEQPTGKNNPMTTEDDITGRDRLILAQALAIAIAVQDALPEHHRQWSNCEDMKTLLDRYGEGFRLRLLTLARGDVALLQGVPEKAVFARVTREMGIDPNIV
jgi:hypothetical protein